MINIIGIRGIDELNCVCGTWLDHWKEFSDRELPQECSSHTCQNPPLVGGLVRKYGHFDTSPYVVPLCRECNETDEIIKVDHNLLISADIEVTCGQ